MVIGVTKVKSDVRIKGHKGHIRISLKDPASNFYTEHKLLPNDDGANPEQTSQDLAKMLQFDLSMN